MKLRIVCLLLNLVFAKSDPAVHPGYGDVESTFQAVPTRYEPLPLPTYPPIKKPTFNAACCLPHFPADHKGEPEAILDQILFETCPRAKSPDAICEAASALLVKRPAKLVFDPTTPDDVNFAYQKWRSTAFADLAVVASGCCFNIYADVRPGEKLTSKCESKIIGSHQTLINSVFKTSVISAGDVDMGGTFERSVVVGGDYLSPDDAIIASVSAGGPYDSAGFVLGGTIVPGDDLTIMEGVALVPNPDEIEDRIVASDIQELTDPTAARRKIAAQICAISKIIADYEPNGIAVTGTIVRRRLQQVERQLLTVDSTAQPLNLVCSKSDNPCVIQLGGDILNNALSITFDAPSGSTVKINVSGLLINFGTDLTAFTAVTNNLNVVWNFYEALQVYIVTAPMINWYGSIVCPRCEVLQVAAASVTGTVASGNPDGISLIVEPADFNQLPGLPNCPEPEEVVYFCKCLCPADFKPFKHNEAPKH